MTVPSSSGSRLPDFFIVGAPKCGTTALYDYLRQHPQVFMPFHKEPLYFGSDLHHRYGRLTPQEYAALFRDARPDQRIGEASAWYLYSREAAKEIRAAAPSAQIIIMLRNPVDVMYAQHSQLLFNEQEEIADFAEALAAEEDRAHGRRLPPGPLRPENLLYRRMARFSEQVERYIEAFGRSCVHVIVHEDLLSDTPGAYRQTLEFLGVDPEFTPVFTPSNENKRSRNRILQRLIYDPPLVRGLVPRLRRYPWAHALRARLLAANSARAPRRPMDPQLRMQLTHEFSPEVERLGQLIDRDLSAWSGPPT
jgi:hypothetical protein